MLNLVDPTSILGDLVLIIFCVRARPTWREAVIGSKIRHRRVRVAL